jgi:hypothetical protein
MRLSLELVREFQELHLKTFGKPIPPDAAELELLSLAELVRITRPLETKENVNEE